jgi:hypothetical protein
MRPAISVRTGGQRYLVMLGAGLVLVGAARAEITMEEAVTVFEGDLATATMPQIQGGTDQTYVVAIATESHDDVTAVSDSAASAAGPASGSGRPRARRRVRSSSRSPTPLPART